jgi:GGDEF domain-containing protein
MILVTTNRETGEQIRLAELERKNQVLEAEVEQLRVYKDYAYTDVLTEVPNRRFYHERFIQETVRARRGHHPLGLALVGLDHFKEINDQIGHRAGDQGLKFFSHF